jgi:FKBP-type peptidyl-prolyl cis-trans isomerase FkpA
MKINIIVSIFFLSVYISCNSNQDKRNLTPRPGKNEMADLNRYLIQKDRERIGNYIERKDLKMSESPTGLWYLIKNKGTGDFFKDNDRVVMNYDCSLLDGTKCYSSEFLGPKEVILGRSEIEPGLNEGLRLLKSGAEAVFILPPFLAYGLVGDGKKIPPRTTIVYTISILRENKLE